MEKPLLQKLQSRSKMPARRLAHVFLLSILKSILFVGSTKSFACLKHCQDFLDMKNV